MPDYDPATYGDRMADVYDEWSGIPGDAEDAVSFLGELAGSGPALELGIGTGRVALPLAERGIEVHGIDASEAMVEKLYVVFNTFFALSSQDDQVRCFANVAQRLKEEGVFVVEAFVPDPTRLAAGQVTQTKRVEVDRVFLETSRYDLVNQSIYSQNISIGENEIKFYPVQFRWAGPSEMDLMARLAGLRLRGYWEGWHREPFTASSGRHVSVYQRG